MTPASAHGWTKRHREKVNIGIIAMDQRVDQRKKEKQHIKLSQIIILWFNAIILIFSFTL